MTSERASDLRANFSDKIVNPPNLNSRFFSIHRFINWEGFTLFFSLSILIIIEKNCGMSEKVKTSYNSPICNSILKIVG